MNATDRDNAEEYSTWWQQQLACAAGTVDPIGYRTTRAFVAAFERRYGPCSLDAALRVMRQVADHLDDLSAFLTEEPDDALTEPSAKESPDEPDDPYLTDIPAHMRHISNFDLLLFVVYLMQLPPRHLQADEARMALVPLLACADRALSWASAVSLGHMRDEHAFPVLLRMLTEDLPQPEPWSVTSEVERQQCWIQFSFDAGQVDMVGHYEIPEILWRWGDPRAIPALRAALLHTLRVERTEAQWDPTRLWVQNWGIYEESLIHALGHFGAFGALAGIEVPEEVTARDERDLPPDGAQRFRRWVDRGSVLRLWRWQVAMCQAALDARASSEERAALRTYRKQTGREQPERRAAIERLLAEQFGLSDEERGFALRLLIDFHVAPTP